MTSATISAEKRCTKCGEVKFLDQFHRMSSASDGRRPSCKTCHSAQQAAYQADHREQYLATSAEHYRANRESRLEYQRQYDQATKEVRREARRAIRRRVYMKLKSQGRHLDDWYLRRARLKGAFDEYVDREAVLHRDQGLCGICGKEVDVGDFHIDHIVPLSKGGRHNYDNVQVAHPTCNQAKGDRVDFDLARTD